MSICSVASGFSRFSSLEFMKMRVAVSEGIINLGEGEGRALVPFLGTNLNKSRCDTAKSIK